MSKARKRKNKVERDKKRRFSHFHKKVCRELGISKKIENPENVGKILGYNSFDLADVVNVRRGREGFVLSRRHNEKFWDIKEKYSSENFFSRFFGKRGTLLERIEIKFSPYLSRYKSAIDWINRIYEAFDNLNN